MRLTTAQNDRACGALLGAACGDALGVPYEFARPPGPGELAEMRGGGLGDFAPGEWSDDTSMAVAIAEVTAVGGDLASAEGLVAVAEGFLRWYDGGPADIGIQTSQVLGATRRRLDAGETGAARVMTEEAAAYFDRTGRAAGNGALMRTAPVAIATLTDRDLTASNARRAAELTHADPLAAESCVLWCEAIRVAVLEGRVDVRAGLDLLPEERRDQWAAWLQEAVAAAEEGPVPGSRFRPNGFTVSALQAAVAAVVGTPVPALEPAELEFPCLHLQRALHSAVRIGDDTDTVAAIAGALLGARWGASAVPWRWRRAVHGWPGRDGRDLVSLAAHTLSGGRDDASGWPGADDVDYAAYASARPVPHPFDDGVLLGTHASRGHEVDAVVSACRVGRSQGCFAGATEVVESRLMDSEDPQANENLHFALYDAADAVRGLRAEGKRVLLHCVAAQQRTPSIAVAHAVIEGHEPGAAQQAVLDALPQPRGWGVVWDAAAELGAGEVRI